MPKAKQTVCLCMIVKNESKVITRCMESVKGFVSYFCICDTGSTDDTVKVIEEYLSKNGLKGVVHKHEWVNFAHNRNLSFQLGKGLCDYRMTLDADEVIVPLIEDKPALDKHVVSLPDFKGTDRVDVKTHLGNCVYSRFQFYRDPLHWKWEYPVHEICGCPDSTTSLLIKNMCNIPRTDGARSVDPKKYLRDALQFEKFILDHPEDTRAWFYLAQSYRDGGQPKKALDAIDTALKFSTWAEERYILRLRKARYSMQTGVNTATAVGMLLEAYNERPSRPEALGSLLSLYRGLDQFHSGVLIGEKLLSMPYPVKDILFVEKDFHQYRIKDDLSVCYYWTGAYAKSLALTTDLLDLPDIPQQHKQRIQKNHDFSKEKVDEARKHLTSKA